MHVTDIRYVSSFKCAEFIIQSMTELFMKIMIAILTFAALLTSPALA